MLFPWRLWALRSNVGAIRVFISCFCFSMSNITPIIPWFSSGQFNVSQANSMYHICNNYNHWSHSVSLSFFFSTTAVTSVSLWSTGQNTTRVVWSPRKYFCTYHFEYIVHPFHTTYFVFCFVYPLVPIVPSGAGGGDASWCSTVPAACACAPALPRCPAALSGLSLWVQRDVH